MRGPTCIFWANLTPFSLIFSVQALKVYFNCLDVDDSGFIERDELVLWVKVLERYRHFSPLCSLQFKMQFSSEHRGERMAVLLKNFLSELKVPFIHCRKFPSNQSADVV
jgi:hypothetical protein